MTSCNGSTLHFEQTTPDAHAHVGHIKNEAGGGGQSGVLHICKRGNEQVTDKITLFRPRIFSTLTFLCSVLDSEDVRIKGHFMFLPDMPPHPLNLDS